MSKSNFEFDIALSFAGEDRNIVEPIAESLKQHGIEVFYDKFEKAKLWGNNLFDYLHELYSKRTRYVVIFISKSYVEKNWTRLERQASQSKALKSKEPFLLPVMLEIVEVPGLSETIGFLDYNEEGKVGIVQLILEKLGISIPPPITPKITKNIAGRKKEIKLFLNWLNDDKDKVAVVWLYGPSGIGKTELMVSYCQLAKKRGFEPVSGTIGIEDISSFLTRMFNIKLPVSQAPEQSEDVMMKTLHEVKNDISSRNSNMVIAIDTVREFDDFKVLNKYIKHLIDMLKYIDTRVFLLIATQKEPSSFPISIRKMQLQVLTKEEIKELIEIKRWDRRLFKNVELLEKRTGGWPWALVEICSRADAVDYIKNPEINILDEWWRSLSNEEKEFLSILSVISEVTPSSP